MSLFKESVPVASDRTCGIDEAGRGCLAGPVVAAAVVLDPDYEISGITDSKQLSPLARVQLASQIKDRVLAWTIGSANVSEIDSLNILQATLLAMYRAWKQITVPLDLALIDGNQAPRLGCRTRTIIKGDLKVKEIGAASILAKVTRDHLMMEYAKQYPEYGFQENFGYHSEEHVSALKEFGPCPLHRKSFRPVAEAIEMNSSNHGLFDTL